MLIVFLFIYPYHTIHIGTHISKHTQTNTSNRSVLTMVYT